MKYTQCNRQNQQHYSKKYSDVYYSTSDTISEFDHVFLKIVIKVSNRIYLHKCPKVYYVLV